MVLQPSSNTACLEPSTPFAASVILAPEIGFMILTRQPHNIGDPIVQPSDEMEIQVPHDVSGSDIPVLPLDVMNGNNFIPSDSSVKTPSLVNGSEFNGDKIMEYCDENGNLRNPPSCLDLTVPDIHHIQTSLR